MKRLALLALLLPSIALATVSSETSSVSFTGNGVTTAFATSFKFFTNSHLTVTLTLSGGSPVVQTITTHYTVTGAGLEAGGTVTMLVAPANLSTLKIERNVPYTQSTNFRTQGSFRPGTHEDAFDIRTHADQQLDRRVDVLEAAVASANDVNSVAGNGLSVTGLTWNVGAGNGILVAADDVAVDYGAAADLADVTKAAETAGVLNKAARVDHKHDVSTAAPAAGAVAIGNAAAEGTATSLSRSDHVHAVTAPTAPANVDKSAASAGVSTTFARADHKHDVLTAAPGPITDNTDTEGTASSLARADHQHAHGARAGGTLHANATTTTAGFLSGADKVKVDALETAFSGTAITGSDTPAPCGTYTPADGETVIVTVMVAARQRSGLMSAGYLIAGTFERSGATTSQVGATTALATHEDDTLFNATFDVSAAALRVIVTGKVATDLNWVCKARVVTATNS